jgi:hypothetical protein
MSKLSQSYHFEPAKIEYSCVKDGEPLVPFPVQKYLNVPSICGEVRGRGRLTMLPAGTHLFVMLKESSVQSNGDDKK